MPYISLKNAGKHYLAQRFDLEIEKHDFVLVSGDNGTGKTTLIQLVLGYTRPDVGCVESKKIRIGFLPEKAMLPMFVQVSDYLKTISKIKKGKIDDELIHALKVPMLHGIHELSKGNMQKLAIVSTFIGNPDLVILDEPFSGLDVESQGIIATYIQKKQSEGMSFMISTHKPEYFKRFANKTVHL
jgi:ABC-type multidrug transport system ATPase subunit